MHFRGIMLFLVFGIVVNLIRAQEAAKQYPEKTTNLPTKPATTETKKTTKETQPITTPKATTATTKETRSPACGSSSSSSNKCFGVCHIRNSTCDEVEDKNNEKAHCGCVFCIYDSSSGKCSGLCKNRYLEKCINKNPNPKKDSDCGCASCKTVVNATNGVITCEGTCFNSGLACRLTRIPSVNRGKYESACLCR